MSSDDRRILTPGEMFAENLRHYRKWAGLTQQGLARRMELIGLPIHHTAIARIEKGRRAATLDEVFGFARALDVDPARLLTPPPIGEEAPAVRVGDTTRMPYDFVFWFEGSSLAFEGGWKESATLQNVGVSPFSSHAWGWDVHTGERDPALAVKLAFWHWSVLAHIYGHETGDVDDGEHREEV